MPSVKSTPSTTAPNAALVGFVTSMIFHLRLWVQHAKLAVKILPAGQNVR